MILLGEKFYRTRVVANAAFAFFFILRGALRIGLAYTVNYMYTRLIESVVLEINNEPSTQLALKPE
jgi:hypothetical protein